MFPVLAVELDFSAVDEAHELVEGAGFFDGVHGAESSEFVGNVSGIFHGVSAGLSGWSCRIFPSLFLSIG